MDISGIGIVTDMTWYCGQLDPPVLTAPFTPGDCLIESGREVASASTWVA